jgi:hypothetical protein
MRNQTSTSGGTWMELSRSENYAAAGRIGKRVDLPGGLSRLVVDVHSNAAEVLPES